MVHFYQQALMTGAWCNWACRTYQSAISSVRIKYNRMLFVSSIVVLLLGVNVVIGSEHSHAGGLLLPTPHFTMDDCSQAAAQVVRGTCADAAVDRTLQDRLAYSFMRCRMLRNGRPDPPPPCDAAVPIERCIAALSATQYKLLVAVSHHAEALCHDAQSDLRARDSGRVLAAIVAATEANRDGVMRVQAAADEMERLARAVERRDAKAAARIDTVVEGLATVSTGLEPLRALSSFAGSAAFYASFTAAVLLAAGLTPRGGGLLTLGPCVCLAAEVSGALFANPTLLRCVCVWATVVGFCLQWCCVAHPGTRNKAVSRDGSIERAY